MSQYYNPNRKADWNYGGKNWKLSRSKLDLFLECPRCFYLDNKLGVKRPPGYPFNINTAVDTLFKKEFDIHRVAGDRHPLMEQYGVDAVPFAHKDIDKWRDNFEGIQYKHQGTGMIISGAIDDVWINKDGELIIVDYKSTSKDGKIEALDADWHIGYKRQMEVYQWLFRQNKFRVSNTGYFVYANASTDEVAFDGKLIFDVTLIPYEGDDTWVEDAIVSAHKCLEDSRIPKAGEDCDYCRYRQAINEKILTTKSSKSVNKSISQNNNNNLTKDTLF